MPVVGTSGYAEVGDAFKLIRAVLNDVDTSAGDVFTDAVLLPFVNSAYRECQRKLAENGLSLLTAEVSNLDLPATQTSITDTSTPQLPSDLLAPRKLWEKPTGSSEKFQPMEQLSPLPDVTQAGYLNWWEWRDSALQFIGATREITIRLRYAKVLPDLTTTTTDKILIRSGLDAVSCYAAFLAATSRGSSAAANNFLALHQATLRELLNIHVQLPGQYKAHRRRSYRGSRRGIFIF